MVNDPTDKPGAANRLRSLRTAMGLTQMQLSRLSEVSPATIRGLESRARSVSAVNKYRILNSINKLRGESGVDALAFSDIFPNDSRAKRIGEDSED